MFTLDKKEYDETKLDDKGKVAFNNVKVLAKEKNDLLHSLEKNKYFLNIIQKYYKVTYQRRVKNNGF